MLNEIYIKNTFKKFLIYKTNLIFPCSNIIELKKKKGDFILDLQSIIKRCQAGERDAFEELLKSVEKKAFATAYFICENREIAQDILQETYLKCFVNINSLKNAEYFNTWFFKILIRTSWKMQKKNSKVIPMEITSENEELLYNINSNRKNEIDNFHMQYMLQSAIDKSLKIDDIDCNILSLQVADYKRNEIKDDSGKITGSVDDDTIKPDKVIVQKSISFSYNGINYIICSDDASAFNYLAMYFLCHFFF